MDVIDTYLAIRKLEQQGVAAVFQNSSSRQVCQVGRRDQDRDDGGVCVDDDGARGLVPSFARVQGPSFVKVMLEGRVDANRMSPDVCRNCLAAISFPTVFLILVGVPYCLKMT